MYSNNDSDVKSAKHLRLHEWVIVLLFCLILLALAGFAIGRSKPSLPGLKPLAISDEITVLEVKIEGEIRKPGLYRLPRHATMNDLLIQSEALPSADLSVLNWKRRLRNNQTVIVPKRRLISITIKGAVEQPGVMQILSGTRYCHLVDLLPLLPEADLTNMRKKQRFVDDGDCIDVPYRKKRKF
ncbi:MAG: hypothetical protein ACH350_00540 [Parachlamydiaceae bacterium]